MSLVPIGTRVVIWAGGYRGRIALVDGWRPGYVSEYVLVLEGVVAQHLLDTLKLALRRCCCEPDECVLRAGFTDPSR